MAIGLVVGVSRTACNPLLGKVENRLGARARAVAQGRVLLNPGRVVRPAASSCAVEAVETYALVSNGCPGLDILIGCDLVNGVERSRGGVDLAAGTARQARRLGITCEGHEWRRPGRSRLHRKGRCDHGFGFGDTTVGGVDVTREQTGWVLQLIPGITGPRVGLSGNQLPLANSVSLSTRTYTGDDVSVV